MYCTKCGEQLHVIDVSFDGYDVLGCIICDNEQKENTDDILMSDPDMTFFI